MGKLTFDPNHITRFLDRVPTTQGGKHLMIACFPKSGSTRLSRAIAQLPGFNLAWLAGQGHGEQCLRTEMLTLGHDVNWVSQTHLPWSEYLEAQIQHFAITPVALVRNLEDVLCSLDDHLVTRSTLLPMAWVFPEHIQLPREQRLLFIADHIVPWYLRFMISWQRAATKPVWIRYEDMLEDPIREIRRTLTALNLNYRDEGIADALTRADAGETRRNVGKAGRGESLPPSVRERIRQLADWYPNENFSMIGLTQS